MTGAVGSVASPDDSGIVQPAAGGSGGEPRRRRAIVLVRNPANPYSRALRIARTLASEGFEVQIAATAAPGVPEREMDGDIEIRRYPFEPRALANPADRRRRGTGG